MDTVAKADRQVLIPDSIEETLPAMVRTELAHLSAGDQQAFLEEFGRKSKGLGAAYLTSLLYCHYGYLGRWGMTVIMWLAALVTLGAAGLVWWVIDLFRMPGLVRSYNQDTAVDVLRNLKAIRS